jgi:hypothetical protein
MHDQSLSGLVLVFWLYSNTVLCKPLLNCIFDCQPSEESLLTSSCLLGVPSGLLVSQWISPVNPVASATVADFGGEPQHAHRLEDAQGAEGIGIGGGFRRLEAHHHMALGAQILAIKRYTEKSRKGR